MPLKQIKVTEATDEQLRTHLETIENVPVKKSANRAAMLAQHHEVSGGKDFIIVMVEAPAEPASPPVKVEIRTDDLGRKTEVTKRKAPVGDILNFDADSRNDPIYRMVIHEGQGRSAKRPLEVGVNGRMILLPRGEEFDIPARYFEAVKDAIETHIEHVQGDRPGEVEVVESRSPSYPYTVIERPSRAELAYWSESKAHQQAVRVAKATGQAIPPAPTPPAERRAA